MERKEIKCKEEMNERVRKMRDRRIYKFYKIVRVKRNVVDVFGR